MSKKTVYVIKVGGVDVTSNIAPRLLNLSVNDRVGTDSDTATIEIDNTDGRVSMPRDGEPVLIFFGFEGEGVRQVFTGTIDEVKSNGSRGAGRSIHVSAKGVDTKGKAKQPQQRHFDDMTVKDILSKAGEKAGISVDVDPAIANVKRVYTEMRDESFIHLGERLAREHGGNFRVNGKQATMSDRGGAYTASVTADYATNLHSWSLAPAYGRPSFSKTHARWYDKAKAAWQETEESTKLNVDARLSARYPRASEADATAKTGSDKKTTERDAGGGTVTIEGNTSAIPDGLCIVSGTKAGVDGSYRIEGVTHTLNRSSGWVTRLDLKQPDVS